MIAIGSVLELFANISHLIFGEFCVKVLNALSRRWHNLTALQHISHVVVVLFRGAKLKVLKAVVRLVPIDVVDLHSLGDGFVEGFPHNSVYRVCFGFALNAEGYATIPVPITRTKYRVSAPAHAVLADTASASLVADFVIFLKAEDWLPLFHNEHG